MKIMVTAKIGNTIHPKYGELIAGQEYLIEEEDFGDEIFERKNAGSRAQNIDKNVIPAKAGIQKKKTDSGQAGMTDKKEE